MKKAKNLGIYLFAEYHGLESSDYVVYNDMDRIQ